MSEIAASRPTAARPIPRRRPLLQRIIGRLRYYAMVPAAIYSRERLRFILWLLRLKAGKPLLVFVRFGAIGDIVCTFPALEALQRAHPSLHSVYVTLAEFSVLPKLATFECTVIRSSIHCAIPALPTWVAPVVVAPRYTDERGGNSYKHLVEEFCDASSISCEPNAAALLRVQTALLERVAGRLGLLQPRSFPVVAIHTGPSWKVREWPHEHWQQLVSILVEQMGCRVLHIGSPRHVELGKQDLHEFKGAESVVDRLSLEELTALLAQVDLLVGIDSGMLHLAGAVGTPIVGLFGPTNPEFRLARKSLSVGVSHQLPCSFCHHRQPRLHWQSGCPYNIECMLHLTVDDVEAACKKLLDAKMHLH